MAKVLVALILSTFNALANLNILKVKKRTRHGLAEKKDVCYDTYIVTNRES